MAIVASEQCLKTRRQQAEQAQAWHSRCCLRRALNGWRHWCAPRTKARMVTANRSRRLLQLAWNQWVEATQRQQSTTVSAVFATWRKYASQMKLLRSTRLAAQARRDALLQCRMWHHWRDATCRKAHHLALYTQLCTERMARVQRTAFRIWMLAKALRKHTRNNERQLVPTLFFRWRSRLDYVQKKLPDLLRTFVNQQKIRDTRHYLAWWRLSLRRCRQFSLKSQNVDRDICWRKFFHRWKNLHDMRESQIEQATSLRRLRSLTVIVRHWQDLAAIRGENRERGVIDSFHALKRRWLLRRCFAAFTDQVLRNRQSRLLTSVASKHYLSSLVKRSIQRWKAACHRAGLLRAFAAARYRSYLQRGVLQSWVRARLKRTRQSHAFRLLHSVHVHHLTHEGILRWHDHSVSMRHLRTRCDAVVSVRQKRKITIVWDSWRQCFLQRKLGLQAQLFLVRGNKSIIAGAFCFWRQRHHELLAARWYDARTKLVCWSTWNGRQLMRFHCRLASQLYHKRLKRLAFRAWLWRLWRDVAASTFGTLTSAATRDMCGAVGLRPELTPVMFSRYIRTPPQYNVRDKEGRIHGILATTTVHVPMLLPLDHGSVTTTWPSPLSGRMTLNTHRIAYLKARKQMSIAADDLYRRRLSRKTFCSWVGARRTEVKLRELAIRLASVYGHRRAKTVLRAWVRRTRSMLEKGEHAVTVNAWNVMNRTFLAWKRNTESCGRSAEFAQRLGDHLMCARAWNVWRSRSCDLRLNQRKDTLNAQVSEFRNRKVYFILGSALHKWRRTTKRHAAALATAKTHYRARKIRCVLRFWMGATAGAKVQRLAEAHAVTLHAATLQRRAFSTWWTKYHGLVAERALTLATRQHLLHGYFSMWRARWSRQQRLANQVEALSYLQRILAASRCQRIVNEWRLLVKKRRDLRAAESAFTSRALHFYGLPTKTRVDSGTTRRTICLKAYMRVWVEKHTGLRSDLEKRHRVLYDVLRKWHAWTKYAIDRQRRIGAASNTRLSENYFYIWHRKAVVARKLEKLATAESKWRQQTLAKWLPKWRSRTVTLEEMQSLADDFCGVSILRRRVLQWLGRTQDRMKRRELRSTDQQTAGLNTTAESWKHQAVDDYLYKQEAASSLWRKHLLLRAWRNWRKHVQVKVFESQRKMIFAKTWANKILKRKILAGWRGLLSKENEQPARFKRSPSDFSEVRVLSSLQGDWFGAEVLASTPRRPKMNR
ncbi:hypothetical protein BC832DRAFT_143589 [Gaertneriomyces semiglobifer]|nr:hypothetical protein BC832DRAFT_143589 [Gaertneriomyces semiglobifer]